MTQSYQSEIRDSTVRDLLAKVKANNFGSYMRRVKLDKVRAFEGELIDFEFPVTALIATNGGGKSTVLGSVALAYKMMKPATFFPKSSLGDESMSNWAISYDLIEKSKNTTQVIQRKSRFKNAKWSRDDIIDKQVLYFGIARTVPAGERRDFKKLATINYKFSGSRAVLNSDIVSHVARILGKDVSRFEQANIDPTKSFFIGSDGTVTYSEFHFGAGESSVIRMVALIEGAPKNSLVLIEEIENGLHPVAVRRMVEYLIDAAERRSIQTVFTTHSEDALMPLPSEGIWYSIEGKLRQGRISIDALRAISGKIEEGLAIVVEDSFAKDWVEAIIRSKLPDDMDAIGVYAVSGDSQAYNIHAHHKKNPAVAAKLKSVCVLDGDSSISIDGDDSVFKLPGRLPESEVFNYVHDNIDRLAMRLAVGIHLAPEKDSFISKIVKEVSLSNRDPHLLFNQVGLNAGFVSSNIVISAFISLWIDGNADESNAIANKSRGSL